MLPNPIAIVVPGHGGLGFDRVHRISPRSLCLVAEAARLAERLQPEVVVLSGWSSSGGPSEAEQMRDAWHGPDVELLVEPEAQNTAQNATRTLPLLLERDIETAVVVCTQLHVLRVRLIFGGVYRGRVRVRFHAVHTPVTVGALAWELGALPFVPLQLLLARG